MTAICWCGTSDVRVDNVPDTKIEDARDAIVKVTSTAICGSDLHLYDVLGPFIDEGDILGHEPMGVVEEVGSEVTHIQRGDRVVAPFNVVCGHCWMCSRQLHAHCETTQNHAYGLAASFFGYTKLYGHIPGGQAEYLRVPQAHFGRSRSPRDLRTSASYISRTCFRPPGRPSSTPTSPRAGASPSSASDRSGR